MDTIVPVRGFADRLGGRWAVSIAGLLTAAVVGLLGHLGDFARLRSRDTLALGAGLLAAYAINGMLDYVLHRTRWSRRHETPVAPIEVMMRLAVSGLVFASMFVVLREGFGVDTPLGTPAGFITYPLVATWIGASIIVYLDVIDQARHIRERVILERSRTQEISRRAQRMATQVREQIDVRLNPEFERLRTVAESTAESGVVSDEIRSVVEHSVRGVGRQLWSHVAVDATRIGLGEILRAAFTRPTFRPWPIIGLTVILPLVEQPHLVRAWTPLVVGIIIAVLYGECRAANVAMSRWPRSRLVIVVGVLAAFVSQAVVVDALGTTWGQPSDNPGIFTVVILTVVLIMITSALGSYRDLDDHRAAVLASDMQAGRLEAASEALALSEETRRLASLLHGRVQSRLLGCAMAIEFARDDPVAIRAALDRTVAVLDENWDDATLPVTHQLDAVLSTWSGLATVTLTGRPLIDAGGRLDHVLVIEELIANAVRHGGAHVVDISIVHDGDDWIISATDDGSGGPLGRPGMGSAVLETAGSVQRTASPRGWTVTVALPTSVV